MKWYHGLEAVVEEQVPLANHTWYRLGGAARYFCTPGTVGQVAEIVRRAAERCLPLKVLGAGANVLVRDQGFDGIVLHLPPAGFGKIQFSGSRLLAGGAADLFEVVRLSVRRRLAGLECLAGIPASVGGAVRMNAGGQFGDIGSVVSSVSVVDGDGTVRDLHRGDLSFSYRRSNLTDTIIVEASFALTPQDEGPLQQRYQEIWDYKRTTQPFTRNNAGCMFKNPTGHSAGALIDHAGLKGARCGGASVCEQHANFIVTEPRTRTDDILNLVAHIQERVQQQFAVRLELEVEIW